MKNKISTRKRESNDEFSATAKAASLLRMAIITRLCGAEDSKVSARMMALMSAILKTDPEHIRGERRVENGNLKMLQGFRFNVSSSFTRAFNVRYTIDYEKSEGKLITSFKGFEPGIKMQIPASATHFVITSIASALDFKRQIFDSDLQESALFPVYEDHINEFSLESKLDADLQSPVVLILGIDFYNVINDRPYKKSGVSAYELVRCFTE